MTDGEIHSMNAYKEKIWIVIYSHRHGLDAWPILQNADEAAPTNESVIASIPDWEGDSREDEFIEIIGPWTGSH